MLLPVIKNPNNGFTVLKIHYSCDPEKNKPEWIKEVKRGMTERAFLREYEIDYSTYSGKPFFPEFKELNISKIPFQYKSGETLYRGWDFGFHRPCVLITKLDEFDRWCWMKVILGQDEGIKNFGKRIREFCLTEYPGAKWLDACDPAGRQISDKSEKTSVQILNMMGIFPQTRKQEIKLGAEIIRQKLQMRTDGKMGLLVDPTQEDLIDGFKGGIHYPDVKEGKQKEIYEKDGYYDHIFDAARYLAVEMFNIIGQQQIQNEISQDPNKARYAMGSPWTSADTHGNAIIDDNELEGYF